MASRETSHIGSRGSSRRLPTDPPPVHLVPVDSRGDGLHLFPIYFQCTNHADERYDYGWVVTFGWEFNYLAIAAVLLIACGLITTVVVARLSRDAGN